MAKTHVQIHIKTGVDRCAICGVVRRSHDDPVHNFAEPVQPVVNRHTETPDDWALLVHRAAKDFLEACCLTPTPDAIEQLTAVFLPCLQIMCDDAHPWDPNGGTWRKSGIFGAMTDAKKKWERFWERTWRHGKRHDDSGFDLINYVGFVMRADPDSGWGEWGAPGVPEGEREGAWPTMTGADGDRVPLPNPAIPMPVTSKMSNPWLTSMVVQKLWPDGPPDPMTRENWENLHDAIFGSSKSDLAYRGLIEPDRKPSGEFPPDAEDDQDAGA